MKDAEEEMVKSTYYVIGRVRLLLGLSSFLMWCFLVFCGLEPKDFSGKSYGGWGRRGFVWDGDCG